MTTKTDKKDPGEWGGLVCVHAFARPVLAGTGDRGCVVARPATAGTVINGLRCFSLFVRLWRFSKDNATSKEDVTARGTDWTRLPVLNLRFSGQGRVTSATAFCLFSRCHQGVNFITFFYARKR